MEERELGLQKLFFPLPEDELGSGGHFELDANFLGLFLKEFQFQSQLLVSN